MSDSFISNDKRKLYQQLLNDILLFRLKEIKSTLCFYSLQSPPWGDWPIPTKKFCNDINEILDEQAKADFWLSANGSARWESCPYSTDEYCLSVAKSVTEQSKAEKWMLEHGSAKWQKCPYATSRVRRAVATLLSLSTIEYRKAVKWLEEHGATQWRECPYSNWHFRESLAEAMSNSNHFIFRVITREIEEQTQAEKWMLEHGSAKWQECPYSTPQRRKNVAALLSLSTWEYNKAREWLEEHGSGKWRECPYSNEQTRKSLADALSISAEEYIKADQWLKTNGAIQWRDCPYSTPEYCRTWFPEGAAMPAEEEKTEFDVILVDIGGNKASYNRDLPNILGLSRREFRDARDLNIETSRPIKTGVSKDEANEIKMKLEAMGYKVEIK